jgi:hypothetical protein
MATTRLESFVVRVAGNDSAEVNRAYKAISAAVTAARTNRVILSGCRPYDTSEETEVGMEIEVQPGGSNFVAREMIAQVEHMLAFGKLENGSGRQFGMLPTEPPSGKRDHDVSFMHSRENNNTHLDVRLG